VATSRNESLNDQLLAALADAIGQSPTALAGLLGSVDSEREMFATLAQQGLIAEEDAYRVWARFLGLPFHSLEERTLDPDMLHRLPLDLARRYGVSVNAIRQANEIPADSDLIRRGEVLLIPRRRGASELIPR